MLVKYNIPVRPSILIFNYLYTEKNDNSKRRIKTKDPAHFHAKAGATCNWKYTKQLTRFIIPDHNIEIQPI